MLTSQTLHLLADFLGIFAASESEIESQRLKLAQVEEFDPHSSFQIIDRLTSGYITSTDIATFLQRYHIRCSETQISAFIEAFDSGSNSKLTYSDFLDAVLPSTNFILRQVAARRHTYIEALGKKSLLNDADQQLANLLQLEISYYDKINAIRQSLVKSSDWDVHLAFCNISTDRAPSVDQKNLLEFFKKHIDFALSIDKLIPFFRRYDQDNDGKINFIEFQAIFLSKSPKKTQQSSHPSKNLTLNLEDTAKPQTQPPRQIENQKKEFLYESQGSFQDLSRSTYQEAFQKRHNVPPLNSQKIIADNKRTPTPIEHLHKLVEDALTRSQAMRARSVSRSRNTPMRENVIESEHSRRITPIIPSSSPKKTLEFNDETPKFNKSPINLEPKSRHNKSFEIFFSPSTQADTSAYQTTPSQSYMIPTAGFNTNPEPYQKSLNYSCQIVQNHHESTHNQEKSTFREEYEQMPEISIMSRSYAVPSIPESNRKKILEDVVSKYANVPRGEPKKSPRTPDTQRDSGLIKIKEFLNAPRPCIKLERTEEETSHNPVSSSLTACPENTTEYRTPERQRSRRIQDEDSQLNTISPEKPRHLNLMI